MRSVLFCFYYYYCLIIWKTITEKEQDFSVCRFIPQMAEMAGIGPGWNQEAGIPFWSSGCQMPEASSTVLPGTLARSWIQNAAGRTHMGCRCGQQQFNLLCYASLGNLHATQTVWGSLVFSSYYFKSLFQIITLSNVMIFFAHLNIFLIS